MSNSILDALATAYVAAAEQSNALAQEAQEKTQSTAAKDIREFRTTSDDEKVAAFRKYEEEQKRALAEARESIDKYIAGLLGKSSDVWSEEQTEAKREEHKVLKSNAASILKTMQKLAEDTHTDMPEVPALLNFSGKAAKSGASSTGTKRPRFDAVSVNGEEMEKPTLSSVSQVIKSKTGNNVSASDILDVFREEHKTDNPAELNGESVTITETDKNGVTHKFEITVWKAVEESDDDENDDEGTDEE